MKRFAIPASILMLLFVLAGCASDTPLMRATAQGDINAARDMLDRGAKVNEMGAMGYTALHSAIESGKLELVRLLLERGAEVNTRGDVWAEPPLMYASLKGNVDMAGLLLERGADVNGRNYNGWTPLAYASKVEMSRLLVEKGADVNAANNHGGTPLSSAAMAEDREDIARFLLERGADFNAALSQCEGTYREWSESSNKYMREIAYKPKRCIDLLGRIKAEKEEAKRQEFEIAKAKAIEAEKTKELKAIVEALRAADQPRQPARPPAVSDIGSPMFAEAERLMTESDMAVIIGIEGYQGLPKSDYSYDDAVLVKEYARALGFRERNIELLLDERATKTSIEKSIEAWLVNKTRPGSRVFVYYSGHGAPDPATGEAYLVPYDGDPNYIGITGYPLKRLYASLEKLPAAEVIVVLDACFSGAGGRSVIASGARPIMVTAEKLALPGNMAVITSTQGAQISTSSPDKGHGVFTYYFLKALRDGRRTASEIYEYVKPLVEDEAKTLNVQQSPAMMPDAQEARGRFELRR